MPTDKPGALRMTARHAVALIRSTVPWNGPVVRAARATGHLIAFGKTVDFFCPEASPSGAERQCPQAGILMQEASVLSQKCFLDETASGSVKV
jgi:acyl-CoA reductase-like NAD-dependent aldehyde dehydrogenase